MSNSYLVSDNQYMCEGRLFYFRPGLEAWDHGVIHEVWLSDPYRLTGKVSNGIVIDIGGNIGVFALSALREGALHVYSYEPEPSNATMYRINCGQEMIDGKVTLDERAVWDGSGDSVHVISAQSHSAIAETDGNLDRPNLTVVKTVSLNDILAPFDLVDFLKIDTEGSEPEIITACDDAMLKRVKHFAMEYHGWRPEQEAMFEKLSAVFVTEIDDHGSGGMLYGRNVALDAG